MFELEEEYMLIKLIHSHCYVPTMESQQGGTDSAGLCPATNLPVDTADYSQETKYYRQVTWVHTHRIWELNPETR